MPDAPEAHLAALRRLHQQIHRDDPPPATPAEAQAAQVLTQMRQTMLTLVLEGVPPTLLETALFYHWLRVTTLVLGLPEPTFTRWAADLGAVMRPLVALLQQLVPTLPATGPTPAMAQLAEHVQHLKDALQAHPATPLTREAVTRAADRTNRALFSLVGSNLEAQVAPGILTTVLLYYWCRTSTINANVPEVFFQTLERHWNVVVERVEAWMRHFARQAPRT